MSDQVWVVGEVLIDLIPDGDHYTPVVGGGPANTAKALAKLGVKTYFIDGISNDEYGQMAKAELLSANVLLDYAQYSNKPTCTAKVTLSKSGSATYEFVIDERINKNGKPIYPKANPLYRFIKLVKLEI